jgi:hypothetical protein
VKSAAHQADQIRSPVFSYSTGPAPKTADSVTAKAVAGPTTTRRSTPATRKGSRIKEKNMHEAERF